MWRKILIVVAVILLVTGIGFLLYPPVSNFINKEKANAAADNFDKSVESVVDKVTYVDSETGEKKEIQVQSASEAIELGFPVDDQGRVLNIYGGNEPMIFKNDLDRLYEDSLAYNRYLFSGQGTVDTVDYERKALDLSDYGISDDIYGYLTAGSIGLRLPIYLGATYYRMSIGAAHLYGTSLPVGSDTSNVVLAGHTNYTGKILFDNLSKLNIGDVVSINNYWETIDYKVVGSRTVTPDMVDDLLLKDGKQLLTLVTCIGNMEGEYDRYLVFCERSE